MTVPAHLVSTAALITKTFPEGVPEADYLPLLAVLYPHMADENLVEVVSLLTGRERGAVLNDVYAAGAGAGLRPDAVEAVRARLVAAGLDQWASAVDYVNVCERVLIGRVSGPGFEQLRTCLEAGADQDWPGPAHSSARSALTAYTLRQHTMAKAGIPVPGLSEILSELSTLPPEDRLLLFHFVADRQLFTVFVHEVSGRMAGCVALPRRDKSATD